jgi:hypothetical protein
MKKSKKEPRIANRAIRIPTYKEIIEDFKEVSRALAFQCESFPNESRQADTEMLI